MDAKTRAGDAEARAEQDEGGGAALAEEVEDGWEHLSARLAVEGKGVEAQRRVGDDMELDDAGTGTADGGLSDGDVAESSEDAGGLYSSDGDDDSREAENEEEEEDGDESLFEMEHEELRDSPATRDAKTVYSRISGDWEAGAAKLDFVQRVALFRDRKYAVAFLGSVAAVLILLWPDADDALASRNGRAAFLGAFLPGLLATAGVNAAGVTVMLRYLHISTSVSSASAAASSRATPLEVDYVQYAQPVEAALAGLLALLLAARGMSLWLSFAIVVLAIFDFSKVHNRSEGLQFASVTLRMALDLVNSETSGQASRRTVFLFGVQNALFLLLGYAGAFVGASVIPTGLLMFALFWGTQTTRSLQSFCVTGSACFRLLAAAAVSSTEGASKPGAEMPELPELEEGGASDKAAERPAARDVAARVLQVDRALFGRALTVCFGSVCAGGLMVGPLSFIWGLLDLAYSVLNLQQPGEGRSHDAEAASPAPPRRRGSSFTGSGGVVRRAQQRVATSLIASANRFAWARVSLRGTRFVTASQGAWSRLASTGVRGAVEHDVLENVLRCWSWAAGALTASLVLLLVPSPAHEQLVLVLCAFVMGAANMALLLEPLRAAAAAIFIAFSEDAECFRESNPIVFHRLSRLSELSLFVGEGAG